MQDLCIWVAWKFGPPERNGKKRAKIPYTINGDLASSTDPETWSRQADVLNALAGGRYDGVNFATGLHEDGYYYLSIDIDDAFDVNSNLTPDAKKIIELARSYAERSPSGKGVRIILRSRTPCILTRHRIAGWNVEVEWGGKFQSVTGNHIGGTPDELSDGQDAIAYIQRRFAELANPNDVCVGEPGQSRFSDDNLIRRASRAKNGKRFDDLMSAKPFTNESEADFELACIVSFWSNRDHNQIERIISNCPRGQRAKWKNRPDYRRSTIEAAIRATANTFGSGETSKEKHPVSQPIIVCLCDVEARPVNWLWPNRIPFGKITLLAGYPGYGKSFATLDMAMRVSTGTAWPDGPACPIGDVLIISAEDDPADTLRPRLDGMGADVTRIQILSMVQNPNDAGERMFSLLDLLALESAIQQIPACKLIIIDPIGSFVGGETNTDKDNQVRSVLAPVAKLAEQYGVAVLIVAHRRKASGERADDSILGSVGFVGIARATMHLVRDRDDKERRLLLPGKNNLAPEGTGLAFKIIGRPGIVQWEPEPVTVRADDFFSAQQDSKPGPDPTARNEAGQWLVSLLADGKEVAVKDIKAGATAMGHAWATVKRAADGLPIVKRWGGPGEPGYWRIPTPGASDAV